MIEMMYYRPTNIFPTSTEAGAIAQEIADTIPKCGYPDCGKDTVGCAVHEAVMETDGKYTDASQFLPVCQKHKEWEFAKLKTIETPLEYKA